MNEVEQNELELRLRRVKPARPDEAFVTELSLKIAAVERHSEPAPAPVWPGLRQLIIRWLVPAAAVGLFVAVIYPKSDSHRARSENTASPGRTTKLPNLTADLVKIDQQLVSAFETVARLPSGEPVRFRCENWLDKVVLTDQSQGLLVESSQPRVEVVPVRFESY